MNTDSKLKRFVILLGRAPFILFIESAGPISVNPLLRSIGLSDVAAIVPLEVHEQTTLITVFDLIYKKLPNPITYEAVETLVAALPLPSYPYFGIVEFGSTEWQEHVEWQNVDDKPEPAPVNRFTITIDILTHELSIIDDANTVLKEKVYEGVIHIESLDTKIPFPQALLKECTMDVYDIIVQTSVSRAVSDKTKSKYLLVMQTGQETFNYINLRQIEKDLTAAVKKANFTIEE